MVSKAAAISSDQGGWDTEVINLKIGKVHW